MPEQDPADSEPMDLSAEFAAEDEAVAEAQPAPGKVESLAAVEPFEDPSAGVDIPMESIDEPAQEVSDSGDDLDLDLDLDDLGGEEEVSFDVAPEEDAMGMAEADDFSLDSEDFSLDAEPAAGLDVPAEEPLGVDIPGGDDDLSVDIPGGDDDLSVDIPDAEPVAAEGDDAGFSADAMTMVPPTGGGDAGLSLNDEGVELDADGNPKEKFKPGDDDTLPVWTGKARTYQDPELEKKKKETAKLDKGAKKPAAPGKGPKLPGKAKLPAGAKKPVTKQIKKPVTGAVGPAKSAPGGGDGNFTVFLSPPKGADKKQAAAEIIADIQGIDINSAMTLAGKMIVPVVKGVSEDKAQNVRDRFKDAGLSCRITQKR